MKYMLYKSNENSEWWIIKENYYWYHTSKSWTPLRGVHRCLDVEAHLDLVSEFETEECPYVYAEMLMLLES